MSCLGLTRTALLRRTCLLRRAPPPPAPSRAPPPPAPPSKAKATPAPRGGGTFSRSLPKPVEITQLSDSLELTVKPDGSWLIASVTEDGSETTEAVVDSLSVTAAWLDSSLRATSEAMVQLKQSSSIPTHPALFDVAFPAIVQQLLRTVLRAQWLVDSAVGPEPTRAGSSSRFNDPHLERPACPLDASDGSIVKFAATFGAEPIPVHDKKAREAAGKGGVTYPTPTTPEKIAAAVGGDGSKVDATAARAATFGSLCKWTAAAEKRACKAVESAIVSSAPHPFGAVGMASLPPPPQASQIVECVKAVVELFMEGDSDSGGVGKVSAESAARRAADCVAIRPGLAVADAASLREDAGVKAAVRGLLAESLLGPVGSGRYVVWDVETTTNRIARRTASPFYDSNRLVASGWAVGPRESVSGGTADGDAARAEWTRASDVAAACKRAGDACGGENGDAVGAQYFTSVDDAVERFKVPHVADPRCKVLVGHNVKFDLLFAWGTEELRAFIQRGGVVWDTALAHFYLTAQQHTFPRLDDIATWPCYALDCDVKGRRDALLQRVRESGGSGGRGGGGKVDGKDLPTLTLGGKFDEVSQAIRDGQCTSTIDRSKLLTYLMGGVGVGADGGDAYVEGDVGITERIFLAQVSLAEERGMLPVIMARMDALLATAEMEVQGLYVSRDEGDALHEDLSARVEGSDVPLRDALRRSLETAMEIMEEEGGVNVQPGAGRGDGEDEPWVANTAADTVELTEEGLEAFNWGSPMQLMSLLCGARRVAVGVKGGDGVVSVRVLKDLKGVDRVPDALEGAVADEGEEEEERTSKVAGEIYLDGCVGDLKHKSAVRKAVKGQGGKTDGEENDTPKVVPPQVGLAVGTVKPTRTGGPADGAAEGAKKKRGKGGKNGGGDEGPSGQVRLPPLLTYQDIVALANVDGSSPLFLSNGQQGVRKDQLKRLADIVAAASDLVTDVETKRVKSSAAYLDFVSFGRQRMSRDAESWLEESGKGMVELAEEVVMRVADLALRLEWLGPLLGRRKLARDRSMLSGKSAAGATPFAVGGGGGREAAAEEEAEAVAKGSATSKAKAKGAGKGKSKAKKGEAAPEGADADEADGEGVGAPEGSKRKKASSGAVAEGLAASVGPDSVVHPSFNHTQAITGRLSSSNPNFQNIPRADTSAARKIFWSRYIGSTITPPPGTRELVADTLLPSAEEEVTGVRHEGGGAMVEVDYSQLEIVCQAVLSGDEALAADLRAGVDFHCKRLAMKLRRPYEDVVAIVKNPSHEEHAAMKKARTAVKQFSFQRAYGAGVLALSNATGMSPVEVKSMIENEDIGFPQLAAFNGGLGQEFAAGLAAHLSLTAPVTLEELLACEGVKGGACAGGVNGEVAAGEGVFGGGGVHGWARLPEPILKYFSAALEGGSAGSVARLAPLPAAGAYARVLPRSMSDVAQGAYPAGWPRAGPLPFPTSNRAPPLTSHPTIYSAAEGDGDGTGMDDDDVRKHMTPLGWLAVPTGTLFAMQPSVEHPHVKDATALLPAARPLPSSKSLSVAAPRANYGVVDRKNSASLSTVLPGGGFVRVSAKTPPLPSLRIRIKKAPVGSDEANADGGMVKASCQVMPSTAGVHSCWIAHALPGDLPFATWVLDASGAPLASTDGSSGGRVAVRRPAAPAVDALPGALVAAKSGSGGDSALTVRNFNLPAACVQFYQPRAQNYPVQGLGGEIVQSLVGQLFRRMFRTAPTRIPTVNRDAVLCNTVHDCVWLDVPEEKVDETCEMVVSELSSVRPVYNERFVGALRWDVRG